MGHAIRKAHAAVTAAAASLSCVSLILSSCDRLNPIEETPMTTSSSKKSANAGQTDDLPTTAASWLNLLGRWNMEITSLYGKRMQEYFVLPLRVMQCGSPDDLAKAQEQFSETLLTDYRAAAEKLARAIGAKETDRHQEYAAALLKAQEDARDIIDQAKAQAKRIVEEAEKRSAEPQKAQGRTRAA
ncbi:MAG: hypothetical protein ACT4SY_11180 [Hyphomicrobiales bacterium]